MKTSQNTETFTIAITDIAADYSDPTNFEITFESTFTPAHLRSTQYCIDNPADFADLYDDIDDFADTEPYITYQLNVARRHENSLYYAIKNDHSGSYFDSLDDAINAFSQPVIDFIESACNLLNIPFYPTR